MEKEEEVKNKEDSKTLKTGLWNPKIISKNHSVVKLNFFNKFLLIKFF